MMAGGYASWQFEAARTAPNQSLCYLWLTIFDGHKERGSELSKAVELNIEVI